MHSAIRSQETNPAKLPGLFKKQFELCKVKQGETLYSIANSYNTTVTALKRANSNIATLRPGMVLIIRP